MAIKLSDYIPALKYGADIDAAVALQEIADSNDAKVLEIATVASAVNYISLGGAATTTNPTFTAKGTDTNVGIALVAKGTGAFVHTTQTEQIGPNGATNPTWTVDGTTASAATGLRVKSAAAAAGVALSVTSSGTNENFTIDAKGSGTLVIGGTSTGQISVGRGALGSPILSSSTASLGTVQNSTPTAAQLLGGIVTQTSATGAGTVTLPTGTLLSSAVTGIAVGDSFFTTFANLGGGFTLTITGATGSTVIGNAAVPSAKNAELTFVNTSANTWNVYVVVSA